MSKRIYGFDVLIFGVMGVLVIALLVIAVDAARRVPPPTDCAPARDGMALVYVETNGGGTLTGCVYGTEVQGE